MNVSTIDKSQQDEYVKSQEKGIKALMRTLGDIVVPIVHWLETILIAVTQAVMNIPFGIGGFFVGATYPLAVITGLHHMYVVIETSL